MIVDDNQRWRRLVRSVFSPEDTIIECSSGAEAVGAYDQHRPDWVLMDVAMPGIDGLTSSAQIRSQFPEARIVVLTQYDGRELRARARDLGLQAYVLKDDLWEAVRIVREGASGDAAQDFV